MSKEPKDHKPPRKPPKDSGSRAAAARRQASKEEEIGDTADKITRAPRKKR
jgi:hypothetical protein